MSEATAVPLLLLEVGDHDAGAERGELAGSCLTDARRATGDDGGCAG